jgi:hypothetical protein
MGQAETSKLQDPAERTTVLEQYKALIGDVGNIGTRYATANGFYLAVVTGLIGVLAFTGAEKSLSTLSAFAIFLVSAFASGICWIWRETIRFYGKLFKGKFHVLRELEASLPVKVYQLENDKVYGKEEEGGLGAKPLTLNEERVPCVLMWFFGVVALLALLGCASLFYRQFTLPRV